MLGTGDTLRDTFPLRGKRDTKNTQRGMNKEEATREASVTS